MPVLIYRGTARDVFQKLANLARVHGNVTLGRLGAK